jgi:hypothetical protein
MGIAAHERGQSMKDLYMAESIIAKIASRQSGDQLIQYRKGLQVGASQEEREWRWCGNHDPSGLFLACAWVSLGMNLAQ